MGDAALRSIRGDQTLSAFYLARNQYCLASSLLSNAFYYTRHGRKCRWTKDTSMVAHYCNGKKQTNRKRHRYTPLTTLDPRSDSQLFLLRENKWLLTFHLDTDERGYGGVAMLFSTWPVVTLRWGNTPRTPEPSDAWTHSTMPTLVHTGSPAAGYSRPVHAPHKPPNPPPLARLTQSPSFHHLQTGAKLWDKLGLSTTGEMPCVKKLNNGQFELWAGDSAWVTWKVRQLDEMTTRKKQEMIHVIRYGGGLNSLHPSSSLWSPQSLSPSHCHWAGMHVHSPKALTAHVKWFLPQEHSALPCVPGETGGQRTERWVQHTGIKTKSWETADRGKHSGWPKVRGTQTAHRQNQWWTPHYVLVPIPHRG